MVGTLSKGLIILFYILGIGTILSCWRAHKKIKIIKVNLIHNKKLS